MSSYHARPLDEQSVPDPSLFGMARHMHACPVALGHMSQPCKLYIRTWHRTHEKTPPGTHRLLGCHASRRLPRLEYAAMQPLHERPKGVIRQREALQRPVHAGAIIQSSVGKGGGLRALWQFVQTMYIIFTVVLLQPSTGSASVACAWAGELRACQLGSYRTNSVPHPAYAPPVIISQQSAPW